MNTTNMNTTKARTSKRVRVLVPLLIVSLAVALLVLVYALQQNSNDSGDSGSAGAPEVTERTEGPDLTEVERRDEADLLAMGPVDAPVGLIVFSDYQCPYCAQWNHDTLPAMQDHANAGKLRIEWRDLNVFGPASERAARASYAAAQQDAYWENHGALFAGGEKRPESELSDDALVALAGDLGLDTDQFAADMRSEETAAAITNNAELGRSLGAASTPVFLLGGVPISGAQPTEVFEQAFESALAEHTR